MILSWARTYVKYLGLLIKILCPFEFAICSTTYTTSQYLTIIVDQLSISVSQNLWGNAPETFNTVIRKPRSDTLDSIDCNIKLLLIKHYLRTVVVIEVIPNAKGRPKRGKLQRARDRRLNKLIRSRASTATVLHVRHRTTFLTVRCGAAPNRQVVAKNESMWMQEGRFGVRYTWSSEWINKL